MNAMPNTAFRWRVAGRCIWMKCRWWFYLPLFAACSASALEVQQVKWGFDGQVVPGRFNLLSVLVVNSSDTPFDGTVNFYKSHGLGDRVGAIYPTPCYLSPLTTRWLQFYVFIDNPYDQWRLEWGRGPDDHHDLDPPKWGPPAQVLLSDSETVLSAVSGFKQFPDELFPPTVAATGGLDSLLLDHAPHWEPAKRQAFLNWLRAGGNVHLLMGADGRYPNVCASARGRWCGTRPRLARFEKQMCGRRRLPIENSSPASSRRCLKLRIHFFGHWPS